MAYACDSVSIFGGIIALNREVTKYIAEKINKFFVEIVIANKFYRKREPIAKDFFSADINFGIILAIILAFVVYYLLNKTSKGYKFCSIRI